MKQYMRKTEPVSAIQYVDDNFDEIIKNIALYIEDMEKISIIPPEDNVIIIARAENPDLKIELSDYVFFAPQDPRVVYVIAEDIVDTYYDEIQ